MFLQAPSFSSIIHGLVHVVAAAVAATATVVATAVVSTVGPAASVTAVVTASSSTAGAAVRTAATATAVVAGHGSLVVQRIEHTLVLRLLLRTDVRGFEVAQHLEDAEVLELLRRQLLALGVLGDEVDVHALDLVDAHVLDLGDAPRLDVRGERTEAVPLHGLSALQELHHHGGQLLEHTLNDVA